MVFIHLPTQLTEEEQMLKKKYEKLKKKKKALQDLKAPKPEPPPIQLSLKREGSKADAKEIAKKLLKSGAIKKIEPPKEKEKQFSGFKRSVSLERKRIGADKPSGFQPFQPQAHSFESDEPSPSEIARATTHRPAEDIARDLALQEKRRDGKAHYVNRDAPSQGNTIYVHGFGVDEALLRQAFEGYGVILNINTESDKNCGFVTFDSIDAANKAIDDMNQSLYQGIKLKVQLARRQPGSLPHESAKAGGVAALTSGVSYSSTPAAPSSSAATDSQAPSTIKKEPTTPNKAPPGAKSWTQIAATFSIKGQNDKSDEKRQLVSYEDDDFI